MADDNLSDLKSLAEMAVEYLDLLTNSTQKLIEAQTENTEYLNLLVDATKEQTTASKNNKKATEEETKAKKKATFAIDTLGNIAKSLKDELFAVGEAGFALASKLGTSATRGVQLEIDNRQALAKQLLNFSTDLSVTMEQLNAAQTGFTDAFVGLREGTQISAEGSRAFAEDLKKGFGAEFQATPETFRILTQMGLSSAKQMETFRKSTGQAGLSANQLATLYNKNQLSFLLYGNSFGKAAVQAEKLGINLASIQAAQEGLVTNLDGTIDTVAQLNQLGAQVDFGNLVRIAEQEGPDALMAYVRATVPEQLMQSASTRALFKQLGISVEDYMKSGNKQISAADQLEQRMTETATATGVVARTTGALTRANQLATDTLGKFKDALVNTISGLGSFVRELLIARLTTRMTTVPGQTPGPAPTSGTPVPPTPTKMQTFKGGLKAGAGAGVVTGLFSGFAEYQQSGSLKRAFGRSLATFAGTAIGGALGSFIPIPGVGTMLGASLGAFATNWLFDKVVGPATQETPTIPNTVPANDLLSTPGYGQRTLLTPKGTFALNNADTLLAGTNLFGQNINTQSTRERNDNTVLIRKIDELITMLSTATTTINVNGSVQRVPRMQLVGVYSRNEVV